MKTILIKELPTQCLLDQEAKRLNGSISFYEQDEALLKSNLNIRAFGASRNDPDSSKFEIILHSVPRLGLALGALTGSISFGPKTTGIYNVSFFGEAHVEFGENCTSNGVNVTAMGGSLKVGADCMLADNIAIYLGDNHGVVDVTTGELLSSIMSETTIEEHVWIGAASRIVKNAHVGKGSIIATNSIVTGKRFAPCSLIAGNPAQIKRSNTSWTRSTGGREWPQIQDRFDLRGSVSEVT